MAERGEARDLRPRDLVDHPDCVCLELRSATTDYRSYYVEWRDEGLSGAPLPSVRGPIALALAGVARLGVKHFAENTLRVSAECRP
jgi:hypothetical protein